MKNKICVFDDRIRRDYVSMARFWVSMLAVVLASGCASLITPNFTPVLTELRSGQYSLDPEHAYINFKIEHLGLSKIVGRFNTIEGSLDFDPSAIGDLSLQGIIEAESIDVNNDGLEATLRGSNWFNTDTFTQITFVSKSVQQAEDDLLQISGDLTVRGVTQEVVLSTRFNGGADNILTGKYTLGFSANATIKRSDFGIDGFGALIGDEIEIEMHGEFQRN